MGKAAADLCYAYWPFGDFPHIDFVFTQYLEKISIFEVKKCLVIW
jgi:hypothetical protein